MVTKKEYYKALDTIYRYHRQSQEFHVETVPDWVERVNGSGGEVSVRLYRALRTEIGRDENYKIKYKFNFINEVTKEKFMHHKNIGPKTWNEFVRLINYYGPPIKDLIKPS